MNTITIIGLALIFLGGIGAIILAIGQSLSSQTDKSEIIGITITENKELKNQILELKGEREKLNESLALRDRKIQDQNANIETLSNKLVEKSEYIEEYISGTNRYPYVELKKVLADKGNDEVFIFSIENSFKFPIYNIEIQAFDYEKLATTTYRIDNEKRFAIKMSDYLNARIFEFNTDEIPGGEYRMSPEQYSQKTGLFYILIHSRSKTVVQKVVLIKDKNITYAGYNIVSTSGKVLKEVIYDNKSNEIKLKIKTKLQEIPNDLDYVFTK